MQAAKLIWLCGALAILLSTFALYGNSPKNSDADALLVYGMLVLSAPLGLFILFPLAAFLLHADGSALSWYQSNSMIWLVLASSGYIQWFVLAPKISQRLSARFRKRQ